MRSQEGYIFLIISTWIKVEIKVPVPHPVILFSLILNYQYDYLFKIIRIVEIRELMEILIQDLIYFLNQYFPMGILFVFWKRQYFNVQNQRHCESFSIPGLEYLIAKTLFPISHDYNKTCFYIFLNIF